VKEFAATIRPSKFDKSVRKAAPPAKKKVVPAKPKPSATSRPAVDEEEKEQPQPPKKAPVVS
jgi:hypothetical protein